jgi:hypothetical protein
MMSVQGERVVAQFPDRAADSFAKNFTAKFESLQKAYPIYGRLRHIFDLAVAMEIVRSQRIPGTQQIDLVAPYKVLGKKAYVPHMEVAPTQIDSIVATRKRSDGSISAIVSGGVSIEPKAIIGKLRVGGDLKNRVSLERSPGEPFPIQSDGAFEIPFWK